MAGLDKTGQEVISKMKDRTRGGPLSAQEFVRLSDEERAALREVVGEEGEERMRRLFPAEVKHQSARWRKR